MGSFWSPNLTLLLPGGSVGKESACSAGDLGSIPGQEDPLEKEIATHSSILAWEIPTIFYLLYITFIFLNFILFLNFT